MKTPGSPAFRVLMIIVDLTSTVMLLSVGSWDCINMSEVGSHWLMAASFVIFGTRDDPASWSLASHDWSQRTYFRVDFAESEGK